MLLDRLRDDTFKNYFRNVKPDNYGMHFLITNEDGIVGRVYKDQPCHASVRSRLNTIENTESHYCFNRFNYFNGDSAEGIKKFYNWLANDSAYKELYPIKDAEDIFNHGGILVNLNQPGNYVLSALQLARFFNCEWRNNLSTTFSHWYAQEKEGLNPLAAIHFLSSLYIREVGTFLYDPQDYSNNFYPRQGGGHLCFVASNVSSNLLPVKEFFNQLPEPTANFQATWSDNGATNSFNTLARRLFKPGMRPKLDLEGKAMEEVAKNSYEFVHSSLEELQMLFAPKRNIYDSNYKDRKLSYTQVSAYLKELNLYA